MYTEIQFRYTCSRKFIDIGDTIMIESSEAHKRLKDQIQDSFDFLVLCCHAVPALNAYIKAVKKGGADKLPDPDYFTEVERHERLQHITPGYKKVLGKFLMLSSFSYFEAYIFDLLKEIFKFHGGKEGFLELAKKKRDIIFSSSDPKIEDMVRKLREKPKKGKKEKYAKLNRELSQTSYKFPSDLFAVYAIDFIKGQLNNLKAAQIPQLLQDLLGFNMTDDDEKSFMKMIFQRNKIAHGENIQLELKEALATNEFLRNLAIRIDKHVIKHFFVIELLSFQNSDNKSIKLNEDEVKPTVIEPTENKLITEVNEHSKIEETIGTTKDDSETQAK